MLIEFSQCFKRLLETWQSGLMNTWRGIIFRHSSRFLAWNILAGKTTAVRRIAVQKTDVSRHQWAQLWSPLKPRVHYSTFALRGLRWALNLATIMPRDTSHSDNKCKFFQPGNIKNCDQEYDQKNDHVVDLMHKVWNNIYTSFILL